jgi:hypothetical protein
VSAPVVRRGAVSLLALGLVLSGARARADICDVSARRDPGAPARLGPGPAGFGSLPEACPGSDLALQADAALLVATDDFYGSLSAGVAVRGRYAVSDRFWFSLWTPGVEYRYVANATVTAGSTDLSAGAVGVHFPLRLGSRAELAPYARLLIPTESVFVNAMRYGVDHGVAFAWLAARPLSLVGGATFPALFTDTAGQVHANYQPGLGVEAVYAPWAFFTLVAGTTVRWRFGDDRAFESFDPTLALRFFPWRGLRAELGARLPLFGADRTDAALAVNVGWMFAR